MMIIVKIEISSDKFGYNIVLQTKHDIIVLHYYLFSVSIKYSFFSLFDQYG